MAKRSVQLVILFLLISPTTLRAWGPVGHKAIGMIAQNRLSPETFKSIEGILGSGVSLDQIAACADKLIYGEQNCAGAFTINASTGFGTMPWHFINIPVPANADQASMMSYCPGGVNCVVAQIHKDTLILQDPKTSLDDKRTALMFLVHFVGDVHQPLHGSDGDPHDQGGGFKMMNNIVYQGKPMNLHSLWDSAIGDPAENDFRLPDSTLTGHAKDLADRLEAGLKNVNTSSWLQGDIVGKAALESHSIAQTVIYPAYVANQGNDLLADYQVRMRSIAEQRIYMAGVRLAALLESALKPASVPATNHAAMRSSAERVRAFLEENGRALH